MAKKSYLDMTLAELSREAAEPVRKGAAEPSKRIRDILATMPVTGKEDLNYERYLRLARLVVVIENRLVKHGIELQQYVNSEGDYGFIGHSRYYGSGETYELSEGIEECYESRIRVSDHYSHAAAFGAVVSIRVDEIKTVHAARKAADRAAAELAEAEKKEQEAKREEAELEDQEDPWRNI